MYVVPGSEARVRVYNATTACVEWPGQSCTVEHNYSAVSFEEPAASYIRGLGVIVSRVEPRGASAFEVTFDGRASFMATLVREV